MHDRSKNLSSGALVLLCTATIAGALHCAGLGDAWKELEKAKSQENSKTTVSRLILSGPTNFAQSTCAGPFTVQTQDAAGAPVALPASITVSLSTSSGTGGTTGFYPDNGCTAAITQLTINSGATSATVYYKEGCTAGTYTLSVSGSGMTGGIFTVTVTGGC